MSTMTYRVYIEAPELIKDILAEVTLKAPGNRAAVHRGSTTRVK